jgi:hypothetical protein
MLHWKQPRNMLPIIFDSAVRKDFFSLQDLSYAQLLHLSI